MKVDPKTLGVRETVKLHNDCINDILDEGNRFITVGSDGVINFLDSRKLGVVSSL